MIQEGRIEAIWLKRAKRGVMDAMASGRLIEDRGLAGNADQGGRRQVTVIEQESWQAMMTELSADLAPSTRRANVMVSGIRLAKSRGARLHIGDCVLEIRGETRPCEQMEEALPGLRATMSPDWRGGVFTTVVRGGDIRVGDKVLLRPANVDLFE